MIETKYEKHIKGCQPVESIPAASSWWLAALDFLLPPRCLLCGQPATLVCLCGPCKTDLPWTRSHCFQCGLPLANVTDRTCGRCQHSQPPFTRTLSPLRYSFPADQLVQAFKFNRQLAAGRLLSHLLCEYAIEHCNNFPDVLVPVPLHHWRLFKRGFNQAYDMASYISRTLGIPLLFTTLRRTRYTRAQSGLNGKQRRKNVRGAFYWQGNRKPPRHVALIDDVMTTGSTVFECARVLKQAGARRVDVWVAARATVGGQP